MSIEGLDYSFIFPYSTDITIKRQQIWSNLEKGILFEDTQIIIPWKTTFSEIDKLSEQKRAGCDRTNWFLGKHNILDGYPCILDVMKWCNVKKSNPFGQIEEFLGFDYDGNVKFLFLKNHLTNLLGEPNHIKLENFGDFDPGSIEWKSASIHISLSGIEQFACKYQMYIGLADKSNGR